MITRHPYRAVGAVLAVFVAAFALAGLVGQHGDGPLGGLPDWVGTASYATWFLSAVLLLLLLAYLGVGRLLDRRSTR